MAPVDPRIGIPLAEITHTPEEVIEPLAPRGCSRRRGGRSISVCRGVFDIKDTDLGIAGTGYQGAVVGVGHELDGEDIGAMAGEDSGVQGKRSGG